MAAKKETTKTAKRGNGGGKKTEITGSEIHANAEANRAQRHELDADEAKDFGNGDGNRVYVQDGRDRVYTHESKERWGSNPDDLTAMREEQADIKDAE